MIMNRVEPSLFRRGFALALSGVICVGAHAQIDSDTPLATMNVDAPDEHNLTFEKVSALSVRINPAAWFPRLSGSVEMDGPGSKELDLDDELGVGDSEVAFRGEVDFRLHRWQLRLSAFDFSTDGSDTAPLAFTFGDVTVARGDAIRSSFDQVTIGAEVGYAFPLIENDRAQMWIGPVIGINYVDVDYTISAPMLRGSPRESASLTTATLHGGFRFEMMYNDAISFQLAVVGGTSLDGGLVAGVNADVTWYPWGGSFGLTFGFRLFNLDDIEGDDDFELESNLTGIFFGGSIRF